MTAELVHREVIRDRTVEIWTEKPRRRTIIAGEDAELVTLDWPWVTFAITRRPDGHFQDIGVYASRSRVTGMSSYVHPFETGHGSHSVCLGDGLSDPYDGDPIEAFWMTKFTNLDPEWSRENWDRHVWRDDAWPLSEFVSLAPAEPRAPVPLRPARLMNKLSLLQLPFVWLGLGLMDLLAASGSFTFGVGVAFLVASYAMSGFIAMRAEMTAAYASMRERVHPFEFDTEEIVNERAEARYRGVLLALLGPVGLAITAVTTRFFRYGFF